MSEGYSSRWSGQVGNGDRSGENHTQGCSRSPGKMIWRVGCFWEWKWWFWKYKAASNWKSMKLKFPLKILLLIQSQTTVTSTELFVSFQGEVGHPSERTEPLPRLKRGLGWGWSCASSCPASQAFVDSGVCHCMFCSDDVHCVSHLLCHCCWS